MVDNINYLDKLLELPIVVKHNDSLPLEIAKEEKKFMPKQQLLKTIKISHDSKDNIDL